jgi:hypothetical protein
MTLLRKIATIVAALESGKPDSLLSGIRYKRLSILSYSFRVEEQSNNFVIELKD